MLKYISAIILLSSNRHPTSTLCTFGNHQSILCIELLRMCSKPTRQRIFIVLKATIHGDLKYYIDTIPYALNWWSVWSLFGDWLWFRKDIYHIYNIYTMIYIFSRLNFTFFKRIVTNLVAVFFVSPTLTVFLRALVVILISFVFK